MKTLIAFCFLLAAFSFAQEVEGPHKTKRERAPALAKTTGTPNYQILNINNLTTWLRFDGQSNHSPSNIEGARYPRGTAPVIYQDGFVWGGIAYLDANYTQRAPSEALRIGGQTYNVGTVAGRIIGQGATATPADAGSPEVRCYRIRRDYKEFYFFDEAYRDAAEYFEITPANVTTMQVNQIRAQYDKDWKEWPVSFGAPYIERNGVPGYQPPPAFFYSNDLIAKKYDEPGLAGSEPENPADQVIWTVFNDLNQSATSGVFGSLPLRLEAQVTLWGYKRSDAFGNIYFKRLRLINKGQYWIDSLFVGQWSDPDLGDFGDDLVGCDTLRHMAFCYNSKTLDTEFQKFNLPPPAVGYTLLAGLIVPGAPSEVAVYDFRRISGKRNLRMTSFAHQSAGSPISGDPPQSPRENGLRYWRMLQGFQPDRPLRLFNHPPGVTPTRFPFSGDPVMQTGFVDGLGTSYSFPAGDRRLLMGVGPIRFAPGDTQEVVIATVAGLGADRLSSLTAMRFYDRAAKQAFRSLFAVARPPAQPLVRAIGMDREIILDWGYDLAQVKNVETKIVSEEYAFEGYNLYQLPAGSAPVAEGVKIASFDLINGIQNIVDETFDPASGLIVPTLLQRGDDTGIRRHLRLTHDALANRRFNNGQEYYFAVTAYNYSSQPLAFPKSLESAPRLIKAKPQIPFGALTTAKYGDTLRVAHSPGRSDGAVFPIVVNSLAGTGDSYEVRFDTTASATTWRLRNASQNKTILAGQNFAAMIHVEGGIALTVRNPLPGLKRESRFSTSDRTQWGWDWAGENYLMTSRATDEIRLEGFEGAAGWDSPHRRFGNGNMSVRADQLKAVEIRFAPTRDNLGNFDPGHPEVSYAYRYGQAFERSPAKPEFAPFIINSQSGFSYQDYAISVPLAVYDIDANPPRRLAVGFLENNVAAGSVDGRYWPPHCCPINNIAVTGPREWLFIFDRDYTGATANPDLQQEMIASPLPVMYWATWVRNGNVPWPANHKIFLYPARLNGAADVFTYTSPAPDTSLLVKKRSAQSVNVFPNPYYAGHAQEKISSRRFVTFNNLPPVAKIRIFNLAGQLVRTLEKNSPEQFLEWDLTNAYHWQVASGMYLCHIEMPALQEMKILKLAVLQAQLAPER